MNEFRQYMPVDIHFGNGRMNDASLFNLPYHKALIVTGREALEGSQHAFNTLLKNLEANHIKYIIEDSVSHPLVKSEIVDATVRANDFNCDFVIAFGGGKALDAGKLVARFAKEDVTLLDAWMKSREVPPFDYDPMFLLSVPTSFNNASALNPKAFLYDLQNQRQIRLKHQSLFPKMALIDPPLTSTLPQDKRFDAIVDAFIRSIELIVSDRSIMHTTQAELTLELIVRNAAGLNKKHPDEAVLHALSYALMNLNRLYMPKPWFPLQQISDAIEGYHETLPHASFISMAALHYLPHRLINASDENMERIRDAFRGTPFESNNVAVAIDNFFRSLGNGPIDFRPYGLELALVSDYMVHLKTIYPDFDALGNDTLYEIIERTLIKE